MSDGLAQYARILDVPGALRFSSSGLVARMPMSMVSLGIVLLISTRSGSYSTAGTVSAAFLLTASICAILQARLIDRHGQSRVLPVAVGGFALSLAGVMFCVERGLAAPWSHLCAAAAGAALPQIGASVRARWSHVLTDQSDLHTAFSLEAVVDEIVFIVGPALVTTLASVVHPLAGLVFATFAAVAGTAVLVSQKHTEPPAAGVAHHAAGAMPWRVLAPLVVCAFAMGAMLGGAEVATIAFADSRGATSAAGPLLAVWAIGSMLSGIVTGAVRLRSSNATRFRWAMLSLGVLTVPMPFIHNFLALAICLFISGFAISPTLIAAFAWIEESVPGGRITEGITLFTTGLGAGLAPGAALAGVVADRVGASAAYWVMVVAGIAGAAVAAVAAAKPLHRGAEHVAPGAGDPGAPAAEVAGAR
jgi:MFS family permease